MQTTLVDNPPLRKPVDHIAILRSTWKLIPKILSGKKSIESRWYKAKVAPWNRILAGDIVYFKDAGKPVSAKAEVEKVLQFEDYSERELQEIIKKYGGVGKINFVNTADMVFEWAKQKRYCILIFLKNPMAVEPFEIDKTRYGNACAWMCVEDITKVKKKEVIW